MVARTLYIDIEAAPAKAYIWDLKTRYVPLGHVAEDGYVLCFAAGWEGEDELEFWSDWDDGQEAMIQRAWELLDEADIVVHYNGDNYDVPRLNTEFLRHRLGPPSPAHHIDLFKTVSRKFRVLSKSMQHMLNILDLGSKLEHKGMELWTNCMAGVEEDQGIMRDYNIQDVEVMEELFEDLRPWIDHMPNLALWMEPEVDENGEQVKRCRCGSTNLKFKSYKRNKTLSYKQYHCQDCGAYPRERFAEETGKNRRHDVLTW